MNERYRRKVLVNLIFVVVVLLVALGVSVYTTVRQNTDTRSRAAGSEVKHTYLRVLNGGKVWAWELIGGKWVWHTSNGTNGVDLSFLPYWKDADGPCYGVAKSSDCKLGGIDFDQENGMTYLRIWRNVDNDVRVWSWRLVGGRWTFWQPSNRTKYVKLSDALPYWKGGHAPGVNLGPCYNPYIKRQVSCAVDGVDFSQEGSNTYLRVWKNDNGKVKVWAWDLVNGKWVWNKYNGCCGVDLSSLPYWKGGHAPGVNQGPCYDPVIPQRQVCRVDGVDFDQEDGRTYLRVFKNIDGKVKVWNWELNNGKWVWYSGNGCCGIDLSSLDYWKGGHAPGVNMGPCYDPYIPGRLVCSVKDIDFSQE